MTDLVDALTRWESSGGHWRVLADGDAQITVGLYTCDGGEEMERLTGDSDPGLRAFLAGRTRSDD